MDKLSNIIKDSRKVYIQTHNYPDADAIASACGMKKYVESLGKEAEIIYYGSNKFKPNVAKIVNDYHIKMSIIGEGFGIGDNDLLINTDCQYGSGNVLHVNAKKVAVIDHHMKECTADLIYEDIQPRIGACTTMVYGYLKENGIKPGCDLATVLYYGIFMDTDMFNGKMTTVDDDVKKELGAVCNKGVIDSLRLSSLSFEDLRIYASGILKTERYNNVIFSGIDECEDNLLGHIADLLMEIEGIDIVVAYSQRSNGCKLSVRSYHDYLTADELVKELTDRIGSGGGHINKAGGQIYKEKFDELYPKVSLGIYIRTRIIDYCRDVRLLKTGLDNPFEIFGNDRFFTARKQRFCLRYLNIRDYFQEGVIIKTLEGTASATISDKVIIGVKNEIWPVSSELFNRKYTRVEGKNLNCLSDAYLDEYGVIIQSDSKLIRINSKNIRDLGVCMTTDEAVVRALKLSEKVKVRTVWGDFIGKKQDYLLVNSIDDYYICDEEIFNLTYTF
ncbi:MAG: DHH family phosphoesterase [Bacillota bacterium]|nr:DHH family phosphoesterase [Bacillota bacterium]